MNNCKEFVLDDLMAITAIPVADFSTALNGWQLTPTIGSGSFSPVLTHAVVIGQQPAVADGALIPIRRFTGKAKDDESDSTAGRLHTVDVSCEVDDRESDAWGLLLSLERTPSHLLLTFRDGTTRGFVQATADTYLCRVSRDGAKTAVSFRIQCIMGIQLIT